MRLERYALHLWHARAMPSSLEALASEVAQLRAYEAARQRVFGFCRALDRLDQDLLAAQFWPDAEVDYGQFYRGPIAGFLEVAMRFQSSMRDTQHLVGNVLVNVDGDTATAESYVHAYHVIAQGDDLVQLQVGARYLDRLARRNGEWRISFRTEIMDWGRWLPIPERWFESSHELPKGVRNREDISYRYLGLRI
jgi:SnoaL-like domain